MTQRETNTVGMPDTNSRNENSLNPTQETGRDKKDKRVVDKPAVEDYLE